MELTQTQIQKVESYLNAKGIKYIDIRLEIFDHIVSDIETEMLKENSDFETVFYKVTDKWNIHLKHSYSWFFGIANSAPKIVLKKAKSYFKKWFLTINSIVIVLAFLESKIKFPVSENSQVYLTNSVIIVNVFCILIFTFLLRINSKKEEKTTYSFILETQKFAIILGGIALVFSGLIEGVTTTYSFTLMFVAVTFIYIYFLKKHKEAIKKYKIS